MALAVDGGDVGVSDRENDFGEEAFHADTDDLPGELISATDPAEAFLDEVDSLCLSFRRNGLRVDSATR